jgi:hypothetical protein
MQLTHVQTINEKPVPTLKIVRMTEVCSSAAASPSHEIRIARPSFTINLKQADNNNRTISKDICKRKPSRRVYDGKKHILVNMLKLI